MGSKSKRTASSHTTESETGTHSFKIVGYTLNVGIGVGKFIQSGTFTVGGYDWAIRVYPDGVSERTKEYVGIFLMLVSKQTGVRGSFYDLSLVNQTTGLPETLCTETTTRVFNYGDPICYSKSFLIARNSLESKAAGYIMDNCLTIECTVTVIKESQVSETTGNLVIEVPPSDILEHFGKLLLEEEEGADVIFSVGGETFPAHKIVLAARSPVLKALLYGQMKERMAQRLTVEDIQPDVFKALLQFIYTDSLPEWDDLDAKDYCEIFRHLLAAADRYAMDRLKLLCASNLVSYLDVGNVATTLALADQHNCDRLKDVCIEFMASCNEMKTVVVTEGYANLKRTCPSILVEVLEKTSRHRRI
jgi:speckle-type POZ protein